MTPCPGRTGRAVVRGAGWLVTPAPRTDPSLRLYCLPWAGAGVAAFRSWPDALPPWVEVTCVALPGRERRLAEAPLRDIRHIAEVLTPVLLADIDRPFAFYGHSLGALIGYEVTCRLEQVGVAPTRLIVSGSRAPHRPVRGAALHVLPQQEFLPAIRALQPGDEGALHDDGLAALLLPVLWADFTAGETYLERCGRRVTCEIDALGGDRDPLVDRRDLQAWADRTSAAFRQVELAGGHLFVTSAAAQVHALVAASLGALPDPWPAAS